MKSNTCKACKILVTYKIFLLTLRSEQEICRSAVNVFAYVRSSRPAAVAQSDGTFDFIWQWSCQYLLVLSRPGFKHSMRTLEPTVPPHRVTIDVAPKKSCLFNGHEYQYRSKVAALHRQWWHLYASEKFPSGTTNNLISGFCFVKSFSSLGEFFTYDGNVTIVDERLLM